MAMTEATSSSNRLPMRTDGVGMVMRMPAPWSCPLCDGKPGGLSDYRSLRPSIGACTMSVLLPQSESHKILRLAADMGFHDRPIKPWARRPAEVLARLGCKKLASDVEGGNSGRANAAQ